MHRSAICCCVCTSCPSAGEGFLCSAPQTLTSAMPGSHVSPTHRSQMWHIHAKARNPSPDQRLELLWFLSVITALKQLPAPWLAVQYYPSQKQIKMIGFVHKNTFHSMCSLREGSACQVVWERRTFISSEETLWPMHLFSTTAAGGLCSALHPFP